MTVLWVDGFDYYKNVNTAGDGLMSSYVYSQGNGRALNAGRFDGYCVYFDLDAISKKLDAPSTTACIGCAVNVASWYQNPEYLLGFQDSSNSNQIGIAVATDGTISLQVGSTAVASTAAGACPWGIWNYLELDVSIANSGGFAKVYCNGQLVINFSGDTQSTGNANVQWFNVNISQAYRCSFDDLYVTDGGNLGEMRVQTLYATADVAGGAWVPSTGTDHYATIDEAQANSDTDYISGTTVGDTDLFEFADLTEIPLHIPAVSIVTQSRKTDAGTKALRATINSSGVTEDGEAKYLSNNYLFTHSLFPSDPNTGSGWTEAGINSLQAGVKVEV